MFQKLVTFIKYNNAFTTILGVLFLGFGGALAASPDVREGIVSAKESIVSIDNSYITAIDLAQYTPTIQVTSITEDESTYYVSYELATIDISLGVWRDVVKTKDITVSKVALDGSDLGLYLTKELKEVADRELAYLKEVQGIERGLGTTQKVVATAYSGLIGKLLDPKEEVFAGYTPVIEPKPEPVPVVSVAPPQPASGQSGSGDTTPPVIKVQGNNPAKLERGASYVDLGVIVTDNVNDNLGVKYLVDGVEVRHISLDTSADKTYTITYQATDQAGNTGMATRTVVIGTGETADAEANASAGELEHTEAGAEEEAPASASTTPATLDSETTQDESAASAETASTSPETQSLE